MYNNLMSNSWENKESEARIEKFMKEYEALCNKHDVQLMAAPQLVPSGERGFNLVGVIVPIDRSRGGVKSPINKEDILK